MKPIFEQVSIIGLGLIGGSLGMALRKNKAARRVIGFARRPLVLRQAKRLGAIDDGDTLLCSDWLSRSDLVVIATPLDTVPGLARRVARMAAGPVIVTDAAGTKGSIVRALRRPAGKLIFVGGHPMAGSERSGIAAARADLFRGAACVLTPAAGTPKEAAAKVAALWRSVGARVVVRSAARHDREVARISHLPHLTAVGLIETADPASLKLAGSGFFDTTRIGMASPALWETICLDNRREIVGALDRYLKRMTTLRNQIRRGEGKTLRRRLKSAAAKRKRLVRRAG
ncbi:MAG: prephenate dehydrogenase [Candidatus Omnitrophica bacterium CG11_big_fil_rev_8_21_14_0_20_64_10]|nr:MAG: prephenate dehydrogenase [Candidatus Omnitrophica bacterium CG11_big_fil_rev_8_21_14_0_20_64_10]